MGRAGAGPGSLPPPRRGGREPAVPGAPRMAHRGGEPNAGRQGVGGSGGSPPSQLILVPAAGFQIGGPASEAGE